MVVKVYGFPVSIATQVATLTLKELGVPYEFVVLNVREGEHKKPEYLENMHRTVDDDGFKVFESRAIARYLVAKYGPESGLIPKDLKKNALFEQAMSIESSDFAPPAFSLAVEVLKPMRGQQPSEERISEQSTTLEQKLKVYETIFGRQKYLGGDEVTLADLLHLPLGHFLFQRAEFKHLIDTPNLARWWSDISARGSWNAVQKETQALMAKQS